MAKSVATLTFHQADNYGAVLQAYGLARAIRGLGHSVEIIDYRPAAARKIYNRFGLRSGKVVSVLTRRWRFRRFRRRFLPLTRTVYWTAEELAAQPPELDCVICGSDQIWNVGSYRGFDPPFFLDFAEGRGITRASYAATFAGATDFGPNRERIVELLRGFDHISVRDAESQDIVNSLIGRAVPRVVDPTFLVDFDSVTPPALHPAPYIAVYCLERSESFQRLVEAVSRKLQLPVVAVMTPIEGAKVFRAAGPREWLSVLRHANFVVTNSFHGLCFAIKNHTDFLAAPHSKGPGRLADLLGWFDLADRIVTDAGAVEAMSTDELRVDFPRVEEPLQVAIEASRDYLREVLRG